ncbi:MAG TPA: aldolase/citrate lyase family protein [Bauldia sp.]|nr:aldolase/citrate lyase family protein [Bauldia sp.]
MAESEGLGAGAGWGSGRMLRRPLALKEKLRNGGVAIGAWLTITDGAAAEIFGRTGFDFVIVDSEHGGAWDLKATHDMLMALNGTDTVPIVRAPWNDHVRIKQLLDLGVEGILAPMVNSVEECKALVAACRYPPLGRRGLGPRRASNYYRNTEEYLAVANSAIFVMPQIEHIDVIPMLDQYLAVSGIDAVAIGPNDMAGTAGVFGNRRHPKIEAAVDAICAQSSKRGIPVFLGINTPASEQRMWVRKGVRILTVAGDHDLLASGATAALRATEEALAEG